MRELFNDLAKILLLAFTSLLTQFSWGQTTYYARANGDWTTNSTWSTVSCSGAAASSTPGSTDNVVICTGRTVTFDVSAVTTIANLTIETTGVLDIDVNRNLFINSLVLDGSVVGNGGGDLRVGNTASSTISGTGQFNGQNASTQIRLVSSVTVLAGTDLKFNDNGRFHLNGLAVTNNGKITIGSGSTLAGGGTFINNASTSYLLFSRSNNFPNGTTLVATATGNTVEYGAAGGTRLLDSQGSYYHLVISGGGTKKFRATNTTIRGNLTISNGATLDTNTGARTLSIAGNWINNLGGTFDENNSRVTFNGSANSQTLSPPAGGELFYDLTINNTLAGGSVTSSGNVSITSGRTLTMTSGIFDMATNTLGESGGAANLTATGGDLRLAKLSTTLPELTGTYSITGGTITFNGSSSQTIRSLNTVPANYHNIVLSGAGTKTLGGNITVRGNWINSGSTLAGNFIVTFGGSGSQTITNAASQSFYSVTVNTTGPLILASGTDVSITNTLTLTAGDINLNSQTLTLGVAGGATLVRTLGTCYGGTFRRYFPTASISSTVAPLYGLFPIGTITSYRPVQINSTSNPTSAGFVSVSHTDASTATDVSYNDNEGTAIQRITDMKSTISTATLAGGAYTLSVTFTTLSSAGALANLKMETIAGPPYGVGTSAATTGSVSSPTVVRTLLSVTNLNNQFVIGTTDKSASPLVSSYYSRKTGNWNDVTSGNSTWTLTDGGPSCNCIPTSSSIVYINPTHTVTVNVPATTDFLTVKSGASLVGNSNLTVNYDLKTELTGKIAPTGGSWSVGRNLAISGSSTSTSAASLTITGNIQIDAGNSLTLSASSSAAGNLLVDGTLNIGSTTMTLSGTGASISGSGGAATISGSGTITLDHSKTIASGSTLTIQTILNILTTSTITNLGSVTMTGDITGVNSGSSIWTNASGSTLTTTGAVLSTGTLNASSAPNTVTYNGSGAQTVKSPSTSYYDLIIANAGTKSLIANTQVSNQLTIQDAAILSCGTNTLNGAADVTMTGTSQWIMSKTGATLPELSGGYSLTAGTVTLNPASGTTQLLNIEYYNLTLSGTGTSSYNFNLGPHIVNNNFSYSSTSSNASTLNKDLTVGTFTLTSGTFSSSGNQTIEITLANAWTRNGGTFSPSAGTSVLFSGSVDQTIGGSAATTFTNLEVSNSGPNGLILAQVATVSGTLTFTAGNIVTTSTNILTMATGSSTTGESDDSYVSGPMQKAGNTTFVFPVGKDGSYRPISISTLSGTGTFQAEYFHADPSGAGFSTSSIAGTLTRVNTGEYWNLTRTSGTPTAVVTLSWDAYSGTVNELSSLRIAHWNGTLWANEGNGGTTGGVSPATGTISTPGGLSTFSPFTLAASNANNPLPITLLSFTGELVDEEVLLKWTTASELNNHYFTVEKTRDGKKFNDIVRIYGAGTSNAPINYNFLDANPYKGISYYRLRQTDFDGKQSYSKLIAIDNSGGSESGLIRAYPNPSSGSNINIVYASSDFDQPVRYDLIDSQGRVFINGEGMLDTNGVFTLELSTTELRQGFYLFTLQTGQERKQLKLIVD